jgi:predicted RecB family nuclease
MGFSAPDRQLLLGVRGVGPTVVQRLEEAGINTLAALARRDAASLSAEIAAALGTTCWRNSPFARAALEGAILAASEALVAE